MTVKHASLDSKFHPFRLFLCLYAGAHLLQSSTGKAQYKKRWIASSHKFNVQLLMHLKTVYLEGTLLHVDLSEEECCAQAAGGDEVASQGGEGAE